MERKNRYITTTILATILILSAMLQSNIIPISSSENEISQVSSITDPLDDLIYIYTGEMSEEYFDYVDVELVSLELSGVEPTLDCTITIRAGPPVGLENTVFYTLGFDENNNLEDNCMDYPYFDIDTEYTVIYTPEEWRIERAKYQVLGDWWMVEDTEASFGLASSFPGGFSIDMWIPLTELPELTETLPWRVVTDTFTYPSTFPDTGDFVPDEGSAYLGDQPPEPRIVEPLIEEAEAPRHGEFLVIFGDIINISAVEVRYADDIEFTTFLYSTDGEEYYLIGKDFDSTKECEGWVDIYGVPCEGFDVWSVSWNTKGLEEGLYYIRALMMDRSEQFGADDIQVYFDPVPPIPEIYEPTWSDEVEGVIKVTATTEAEDIEYVVWEYLNCSDHIEYSDFPKIGEPGVSCAWNAKAALLKYWARTFKELWEYDPEGNPVSDIEMIYRLVAFWNQDPDHEKNQKAPEDGLTYEEDLELLRKWIFLKELEDKLSIPSMKSRWWLGESLEIRNLKPELQRGPVKVGIFTRNATGHLVFHAMILTSLWDNPISKLGRQPYDWEYMVDFMDPYKVQDQGPEACYRYTDMYGRGSVKMDWDEDGKYETEDEDGLWLVYNKVQILPKALLEKGLGVCSNSDDWRLADIDYDGSDGWNLTFNTTEVPDGFYFLRATMVDSTGNNCSDVVEVFVNNHPTDLNKDGTVNILDIATVSQAYGAEYNETDGMYWHDPPCKHCPHYPCCDINGDKIVNIIDIAMVAKDYGKTY